MSAQYYDRCHKCGSRCSVEVHYGPQYSACEVCGFWMTQEKEGGGNGAYAYSAKGHKAVCCGALDERGEEPFGPEVLEKLDFAWVSRPLPDGRWEGVLLKGEPHDQWR